MKKKGVRTTGKTENISADIFIFVDSIQVHSKKWDILRELTQNYEIFQV